ncbi:MAG: hypothetical protein L0Z53_01175 [Acidobacteriales bacterium]|nr:hypothetical protein [Terriglobales bacterium]
MEIRNWWRIALPGVSWITRPSVSTADHARRATPAANISSAHWAIVRTWQLAQESLLVLQAPRACLPRATQFARSASLPSACTISISAPPSIDDHAASFAG